MVTDKTLEAAFNAYLAADRGGDSRFTLDRDLLRVALTAAFTADHPYPTVFAYEQTVKAMHAAKRKAERLEHVLQVAMSFAIKVREQAGHPLNDTADLLVSAIVEELRK